MSQIQKEIFEITGLKNVKDETRAALIDRCLVAVNKLPEKDWDELSEDAKEWFNNATDQKNANIKSPRSAKPVPDFPDYKAPAAEKDDAPKSRRRSAEKEEEPAAAAELNEGDVVKIVTARGKEYEGEVVELSDDDIVLKVGDEELEFPRGKVTVTVLELAAGNDDEEPELEDDPEPAEPEVGDTVKLVTSRDKEYEGEILEISEDDVVLKVGKEELEFSREKVKSIVVVGAEPEPEDEPKPRSRRAAAKEDDEPAPKSRRASAAKDDDKGSEDKAEKKRSSNPRGVSVGGRIRELMAEDTSITLADTIAALTKEGLEFRDTSANMIYKDCKQFLDLLKAAKKLK